MIAPAATFLAAVLLAQSGPSFVETRLLVPGTVEGLAALDRDGDGKLELLAAREAALEIYALESGPDGPPVIARLERGKTRTFAWCVAPAIGGSGPRRDAVWLVRDDALAMWKPGEEPVELAKVVATLLPAGTLSLPFARDLNGDGRTDVALPEPSGLRLWFGQADGTLRKGPSVRHRIEADLELAEPGDARPEVAASLSIPSFAVEDANGDGFPDLAFKSNERLQFFWSAPGGVLPESPTFEIDLEEIKQKLTGSGGSVLDPGNLFKMVANLVHAKVEDLDGDKLADLLLQQGPKVSIFGGTPGGIDRTKAAQVLKTSGNLLVAFAADDNGDGKLDLCMLQADDLSIGEALLWVVAGGDFEIDLFTYFQEGKLRFARHPSRRRRMIVEVPAILSLVSELKENDTFKQIGDDLSRVPIAIDLDGDGKRGDVALLRRDGTIGIHPGAAPPARDAQEEVWRAVTDRFDREANGKGEVTIELLELADWLPLIGGSLRAAVTGRPPPITIGSPDATRAGLSGTNGQDDEDATDRLLVVLDLDGDKRDDLLLVDPGSIAGPLEVTLFRTY